MRRVSRAVRVGALTIGGDAPIVVQSMTKTDTRDVASTVAQIQRMAAAGCEMARLAVPDQEAAEAIFVIRRQSPIPIVADIHFDYRLALRVLEGGVDKLRINPGNIGAKERVQKVVTLAQERGVPIRIGVNSGSLEKPLLEKYGYPTAAAMVESALGHIHILEDLNFDQTIVSIKASEVPLMIESYRRLAAACDYPLHLGVTESGTPWSGSIRSAIGIGTLLAEGIGDTVRVSLTAEPEEEVKVAKEILNSLDLRVFGPKVIACPTCGRCQIDVIHVAEELERRIGDIKSPLRISVMGCAVNGPGECRGSDIGFAGGKGGGLLYRDGEIVRRIEEEHLVDTLVAEIHRAADEVAKRERKA